MFTGKFIDNLYYDGVNLRAKGKSGEQQNLNNQRPTQTSIAV